MEKKIKQMCKCEKCGNEAEMVITCSLPEENEEKPEKKDTGESSHKLHGTGVCSHCGNEADMWVDLPKEG